MAREPLANYDEMSDASSEKELRLDLHACVAEAYHYNSVIEIELETSHCHRHLMRLHPVQEQSILRPHMHHKGMQVIFVDFVYCQVSL